MTMIQGELPDAGDAGEPVHNGPAQTRLTNWYLRVVAAFVAGIIVGVAGLALYQRVPGLHLGGSTPNYLSTLSPTLPVGGSARTLDARLETATHTTWGLRGYSVSGERGKRTLAAAYRNLSPHLVLPPAHAGVRAIYTNALDAASVRRNGTILVIKFGLPNQASSYTATRPRAFSDDSVDRLRDDYLLGIYALFYSPAGGTDRTEGLREALKKFTWCPTSTGACTPGPQIQAFADWAPRAGS